MLDSLVWPGLVLLGLAVGVYGTMIGAGGGFVLVPVLLILYPGDSPGLVTSISLAVVCANAASGSIAYARQHRIDYLAANTFAAATVPGAIIGAFVIVLIPREAFDVVFAVLLLSVAVFLLQSPVARVVQRENRRGEVRRTLTDSHGDTYVYSYNLRDGLLISSGAGFLSSLLGIGGGIIHVPAMIRILRFPAHVATATSHYVLTITALTGTLVHVLNGEMSGGYLRAAVLAVGVLVGAQLGALLSLQIRGETITRLLSLALAGVAVRLLAGVLL